MQLLALILFRKLGAVLFQHLISTDKGNDPSWLLALPLLHLLWERCKPFEDLKEDYSHAATTPDWWGIAGLQFAVDSLKKCKPWSM